MEVATSTYLVRLIKVVISPITLRIKSTSGGGHPSLSFPSNYYVPGKGDGILRASSKGTSKAISKDPSKNLSVRDF